MLAGRQLDRAACCYSLVLLQLGYCSFCNLHVRLGLSNNDTRVACSMQCAQQHIIMQRVQLLAQTLSSAWMFALVCTVCRHQVLVVPADMLHLSPKVT
jgi:hypothetical protein